MNRNKKYYYVLDLPNLTIHKKKWRGWIKAPHDAFMKGLVYRNRKDALEVLNKHIREIEFNKKFDELLGG